MLIVVSRALLSSIIVLLVFSASAATTVMVNDPRPVANAVEKVEAMYGLPITYEDPPYVNESEVLDVTVQVRQDQRTNRVLIPRGGTFSFFADDVPSAVDAQRSDVAAQSALKAATSNTIREVLYSYAALRHAEMFKVAQDNGLFHIVPTMFMDASGNREKIKPLLDTTVSVSAKQRNGAELVGEVCQLLSVATGLPVVVGTAPWARLAARTTTITASDEVARSVLSRLLAEIPGPLSWQLFYDPGLHWYVFNIHAVESAKE